MLNPGETLDRLVGDWQIHQLRGGHRFSTDDLLTAWLAGRERPGATRLLDLGCGIGSVGLMTLHQMPATATLLGVEVQALSAGLARRTVALNGLEQRVTIVNQDLREVALESVHDLVTGSPPYIPLGKGVVSPHPQRAGARMELKGDVFDYCRAAARGLAPGAPFVYCHSAVDPRPEQAPEAAGLHLRLRIDVYFRANRAPTIALFVATREPGDRRPDEAITVRDAEGRWTPQYMEIRKAIGIDVSEPGENEGASG